MRSGREGGRTGNQGCGPAQEKWRATAGGRERARRRLAEAGGSRGEGNQGVWPWHTRPLQGRWPARAMAMQRQRATRAAATAVVCGSGDAGRGAQQRGCMRYLRRDQTRVARGRGANRAQRARGSGCDHGEMRPWQPRDVADRRLRGLNKGMGRG